VEIKHTILRASSGDNVLTTNVRLVFDTTMLNVSWLVRRFASVGGVTRVPLMLAKL
jgi:hypothetical protein